MRCPSCQHEIDEGAILSAAGKIAVARRKAHKGGKPKERACRWCALAVAGRDALLAHERSCPAKPDEWPDILPLQSLPVD